MLRTGSGWPGLWIAFTWRSRIVGIVVWNSSWLFAASHVMGTLLNPTIAPARNGTFPLASSCLIPPPIHSVNALNCSSVALSLTYTTTQLRGFSSAKPSPTCIHMNPSIEVWPMCPLSTWTAVVYSHPWACRGGLLILQEQGDAQQHAISRVPSSFQSGPFDMPVAAGFSAAQPSPKTRSPTHELPKRFLINPPSNRD